MTSLRAAARLALVPALVACGSPKPGGFDEAGDASETASETASESSGETGEVSDACVVAGELQVEAMHFADSRAWLLGPSAELELPLTLPQTSSVWMSGASDATHAYVVTYELIGPTSYLHAFDRTSGALVWMLELDVVIHEIHPGDDGSVVINTDAGAMRIVDGVADSIDPFTLRALGGAHDGWIPIKDTDPDGQTVELGWVRSEDLSYVEALAPSYTTAVADGATLEFLETIDGTPTLRRVASDASVSFPIAAFTTLMDAHGFMLGRSGSLRLIEGHDSGGGNILLARVDVESGEILTIDPVLPEGWEYFDCYSRRAALDPDGAVLFELRNAEVAQIFVYSPDDASWSPVGRPFTAVDDLSIDLDVGSTHIVNSIMQGNSYCPMTQWGPAPEGTLVGMVTQVVRVDPPLALELTDLEPWSTTIDASERCISYRRGESLIVQDLSEDAEPLTFELGQWYWLE